MADSCSVCIEVQIEAKSLSCAVTLKRGIVWEHGNYMADRIIFTFVHFPWVLNEGLRLTLPFRAHFKN